MNWHLPDLDSPKTEVYLPNPGYIEYQDFDGPFSLSTADLFGLWGDSIFCPTYPMEMESLAYCGAPLIRVPKQHPELLWTAVNYTLPCMIRTKSICRECMRKYGAARNVP